jgi:large subunit ribosomal protein L15
MQIHQLKRKTENKKAVKVGRGGKRGKTSGRGTKGQLARSGRKLRPELRDIIKKLPKLRGRGKNSFLSIQEKPVTINLLDIEMNYKDGEIVTPATLVSRGLFSARKGKNPNVKILSSGDITKKLTFSKCHVSAGAKEKIEKAGGTIK